MEIISGIIDFSGLKITYPKTNEADKFIYFADKNAVLHTETLEGPIFFFENDTIYIYSENTAIIYRPESIIFKTDKSRLYYTFIGSCLVFSTNKSFIQLFDTDERNTLQIPPDHYGKFSKNGLEVY